MVYVHLKKATSGLPLSQMTTPKHMRSSYLLLTACILRRYKLVRVTKTLLHSTYSILEYNLEGNLVYFIDILESGYHTDTEVNFSVRIVVWVIPSNSSKTQKTPEMNELD